MKGTQIWSLAGELRSYMPQVKWARALQLEKPTSSVTEPLHHNDDPAEPPKEVNPGFAHVTYYLTFSHNLLFYIAS